MRHNNLRDALANIMKEVCHDVKIEPPLLPVTPNNFSSRSNTSDGARLDISACGLWSTFERTFFDIRVSHPHAASNVTMSLQDVYKKNKKEKIDFYEERVVESEKGLFAPMVFLTTGGAGPQCSAVIKRLADKIATKRSEQYSHVITHLRTKLRFALLRSVLISIRGVRGNLYKERAIGYVSLNLVQNEKNYEV